MSLPFALSLSKYVNSTGTDVGFASLLGVALLALLYFAGARETRTLRDHLDEAHDRITSLEARLTQSLRNQAARAGSPQVPSSPGRPGVVPAPALAGSAMGTALARVQREVAQAEAPAEFVEATMALAAPALGSATKLISLPQPAPAPVAVPAMGAATAAAAAAAYAGTDDDEFDDEFGLEDTSFVPAGQTAAAANGRANGGGGGGAAVATPPRVELYDDEAAASGPPPRRTIPTVDTGPSRSRLFLGRLGGTIAAVVVVAVIVVVLLVITSSGGTHHAPKTASGTATQTTPVKRAPVFTPAKVKVSVLNGTGLTGLAQDVGQKLVSAGYKVPAPAVTNDGSEQQLSTTTVSYRTGYGNAAVHIADALHTDYGIALPQTMPASATAITNCGTPDATGVPGKCPADVIVSVGNDLSGAANSSSSG
jgi:hypothetical protein